MTLPDVVAHEQWLASRKRLLAEEKDLTRRRDALNAERRRLPMVRIEKDYVFHGPSGEVRLLDIFEGRRQLVVQHFMFAPEWDDGCPSCSAAADEISDGLLAHLHTRETAFAAISRAPLAKLEDYRARKGWRFPWYSSLESDFNYDFHVTLDERVAPVEYNFRSAQELVEAGGPDLGGGPHEMPGHSCFLRDGEDVFHTYSSYARGAEWLGGSYAFLDLTALGRQEDWEEPKDRSANPRGAVPNFAS